jgi:DNA-binding SARP family transcriptional activator
MEGPDGSFDESDLRGSQGRVAFAALVVERRPLSRDELAELMWDGRPPDKWPGSLTTVVSRIRTLVGRVGLDGRSVVGSSTGSYEIRLPPGSWVDLEDATRRLDRADGALRHGDPVAASADATVAASVLRRPFLAGIDNEWAEQRRRRLREALYHCSTLLARAWIDRGDHRLAANLAEQAVGLDALRETGHRLLMEAEWRRGDRGAALRAFDTCARILRQELGVTPSAETLGLADRIRA